MNLSVQLQGLKNKFKTLNNFFSSKNLFVLASQVWLLNIILKKMIHLLLKEF